MSRILWGLIITAAGAGIVIYTEPIFSFFGSVDWAEQWIPFYGGSRLSYKLFGILLVVIGLMMLTGLLGPVILWLFGGLFSGFTPPTPPSR
ncbi:hypothetical protein A3H10_02915 [Candidatus Uhrbacteria bacterium RIFCSPLOWO2_12_FULL_46_10]|uniref:Uncharacterized protein n=1 Tax=Candidatus Uhrbacteria bacterium RIFCSPLOWO2_01_FULL_47_25 TaxID=1802402 RepID=A0A1F7UXQ5_9BACT|nr:MAG: hypothetical protein A2752_04950 [Candidatus Uhrbacteria bacterium RIFCSPHIGHO2_01_FULL_46_23]OGL68049.1 MAG: hypothetical protein A3D60_02855 [Candidatus Uhrbacteria bacterium RIFCSPHIGHO2_02_FULL_47_29]OGL76225.1 MAG: hypothetical protein A3E96_03895 [Candidatus Uhrbacteria bacterium RIFCSPHIGHO2_12_FULL_46_13]OGL82508.1 MAG: hypothetical protein A2936_03755 [Candidatus Uhrbacteria bacterium RIFCSPLOWO2_01_FULL_47_25]OGL85953.1 MAG: hypothetical protein A3I37_00260 [Candidatus Uhrbact